MAAVRPHTLDRLKHLFEFFDKNGDGTIAFDELKAAIQTLGHSPTDTYMLDLLSDFDKPGLDFPTFERIMTQQLEIPCKDISKEVVQSFRVFDRDLTGFISVQDFKTALTQFGEKLPETEVDEMISLCTVTEDGFIDYEAFVSGVQNISQTLNFLEIDP